MAKNKKIMIIAGEASGDILAADLIKAIQAKNSNIDFIGVAGKKMQSTGMDSIFNMQELSIMGISEVLPHIPLMIKRINQLVEVAKSEKIDLLITIDSPDFCLRVAKKVKKTCNVPCIHYVCPSIWAWRRGRAKKMAKYLDNLFLLFPFEKSFFDKYNLDTTFIGHPVTQRNIPVSKADFNNPILAILPGSRKKIIQRMLPIMLETFEKLQKDIPNLQAIIPLADEKHIKYIDKKLPKGVKIITANRFESLAKCNAALATSGTSNLELAVAKIPMVITYTVSDFTYILTKIIAHIPYASPINWVLNEGNEFKKGVVELLQVDATSSNMYKHILPLLNDTNKRKEQIKILEETISKLSASNINSSEKAAEVVISYLSK